MVSKKKWAAALLPLLKKYKGQRHPLKYRNQYQLLVMVVLSARSTDEYINEIAPAFFAAYKNMAALSKADAPALYPYLKGVTNFAHKAQWLVQSAGEIKSDRRIPLNIDGLTALPGIGRKSANVIMREAGVMPEGIVVDVHTIRVATRLGITKEKDPGKIEEGLMGLLPAEEWDAGMAMSFLGREICRPKPLCDLCLMREVCLYYRKVVSKQKKGVE